MSSIQVAGGIPTAPVAAVRAQELVAHGDVRVDDYYWLRDRDDAEVIAYLEAENAYLEEILAPTADFQEKLFDEIVGRIDPLDATAPALYDGWYYWYRYEKDREYPVHCRRRGPDAAEEIILDENEFDDGGYLAIRGVEPNSDGDVIVYGLDRDGRRKYTLHFRDLTGGGRFGETISNVTGNVAWAEDGRTLFYTRQDPNTLRSYQIWRHVLDSDPGDDVLVYEETDETFSVSVDKSRSRDYLVITSYQTLSTEVRILPADEPTGDWRIFAPRRRDVEYEIQHLGDSFYILTNEDARNFRLMKTSADRTGQENWVEVIAHRDDVLLEDFAVFEDFLVLNERAGGLNRLRVIGAGDSEDHYIDFGETVYTAGIGANYEIDAGKLRYRYVSMTTPSSDIDYDPVTKQRELIRQDRVPGDFDPADYVTERLWAEAADGVEVPISLVHRRGVAHDGHAPLLLYAYGSYGYSSNPRFSSARLSLLDRGVIFAIAHVRGGEEMGRHWYEDGKLLKKMNTFTDFVTCGRYLVDVGYTSTDRLFAQGGSAGGLLMGVVVNLAPELFRGVIADVPFVDVVTTMLDASIPLTTSEYDEWGNPADLEYYKYMLAYSPYDQVRAQIYPNLLVTTGLHDSQVQYWEPAKWVAKLRTLKTDDNLLLLKTNMEAGHGGQSGRFRQYRETALGYAFMLDLMGITQ